MRQEHIIYHAYLELMKEEWSKQSQGDIKVAGVLRKQEASKQILRVGLSAEKSYEKFNPKRWKSSNYI